MNNIHEYELKAKELLPKAHFDYFSGGACDEITLRRNESAFSQIFLKYRILAGLKERDTSTRLLGSEMSAPILIAPTAFQGLAHPDAEKATATAAGAEQTPMILSTLSNTPVEEVVRSSASAVWFQLYLYKDRGLSRDLVQRVEQAGCKAIVLTADAPVLGKRENEMRNSFTLPETLLISNIFGLEAQKLKETSGVSGLAAYFKQNLDDAIHWKDIAWLRSITRLPIVVKGVNHADDASIAVQNGVDALVVSNHGGRQLDTSMATIEVLPRISKQVNGEIPVLVDGGIRRGTDIVKAIALGASAVLVGRPVLWGLSVGGAEGVSQVLRHLKEELKNAMALCGASRLSDITSDLIEE